MTDNPVLAYWKARDLERSRLIVALMEGRFPWSVLKEACGY